MEDKTPLEREIELHELHRTPLGVKVLIAILIILICTLGLYTLDLKRELRQKENEMTNMKDTLNREIIELTSEIKRLRRKPESQGRD